MLACCVQGALWCCKLEVHSLNSTRCVQIRLTSCTINSKKLTDRLVVETYGSQGVPLFQLREVEWPMYNRLSMGMKTVHGIDCKESRFHKDCTTRHLTILFRVDLFNSIFRESTFFGFHLHWNNEYLVYTRRKEWRSLISVHGTRMIN